MEQVNYGCGRMNDLSWKFLGLFTLYLCTFVALVQLPASLYHGVMQFTASAVASFWKIFSIPVSSMNTHVTFYDFTMEIILECTGVHYSAIFLAAVMAFQGHSVRYKTAGIITGISAIFLLNILRVGVLGIVGHYSEDLFNFVHLYLWQGLFTGLVLLIWILWAKGCFPRSGSSAKRIAVALVLASISFLLVFAFLDRYVILLARVSEAGFPLFSYFISVPDQVISEGRMIGYVKGDEVTYSKIVLYTLNSAIFCALTAFPSRVGRRNLMGRLALGTGLLIISHFLIIVMDWTLEVSTDDLLSSVLLWCIVLMSILGPLLAWMSSNLIFGGRKGN